MTLLQRLIQANYQTNAIEGELHCSFSQLLASAQQIRSQHPALKQQSVAVRFTNLLQFCAELLAFDGWCRQLYLLPENMATTLPDGVLHYPAKRLTAPQETSRTSNADTQWLMATSGTTGTPKWIGHSLASLTRAVKLNADSASLRWALCYQATRFAGLQVLLQSLLSGGTLIDCSSGDAKQRLASMQRGAVNAVSATPSLWRQLLMTGQLSDLSLRQVTLGGEIADQAILDTLAQLFPKAKLLHIYASTEAGVGFAVADRTAGFPASWLQQRQREPGFKIDAKQHLWLKPPHRPDDNLTARLDADGFVDTEDLVEITDGRVYFLGRASGAINVGGNKVHPEQVEQVLLLHPAVLQARVYAKNSSVLGQLVVADVVAAPDTDSKALKLQLILHCQQFLQRYQFPAQFHFVEHLTTNASGKLSRQLLEETQHD